MGESAIRRRAGDLLWPFGTVLVAISAWEVVVRGFDIPQFVLAPPSSIAVELWQQRVSLFDHGIATTGAVLGGFGLAIAVSVPLALGIVYFPFLNRAIYPLLIFSQTVPKIAIVPVFVVWLGFGLTPKILIAFLICFFPIVIDTVIGLRSVPPEMLSLVKSMGGSRWDAFRRIRIPNSLPYFFSGLKVASTLAVVGAIVGEFVGSNRGLGFVILQASSFLNTRLLFAAIFLLTIIGVVIFYIVEYAERLSIPWHVTQRSDEGAETIQQSPSASTY